MHICAYSSSMDFEWDPRKAGSNLRKHGIDFADAVDVLYDELAVTIRDPYSEEERFVTLGMDGLGRLLVIVFSWRGEQIRLISARQATAGEKRHYEEGK